MDAAAAAHRRQRQDALYNEAHAEYGPALRRLVRGYEAHPDRQADLLQEMHLELWRSLAAFDGRCSLRTWVYRVANNVGASHVVNSRRRSGPLVDLETLEPAGLTMRVDEEAHAHGRHSAARVAELIHRLKPLDRQVILLHLEGESAAAIAEVTGLSAVNVATKVHRIKKLLQQQYLEGAATAHVEL